MPRRARDRLSVRLKMLWSFSSDLFERLLHQQPRATPRDAHALAGVVWRRTGLSARCIRSSFRRTRVQEREWRLRVGRSAAARWREVAPRTSQATFRLPSLRHPGQPSAIAGSRQGSRRGSASSRMERPAACGPAHRPCRCRPRMPMAGQRRWHGVSAPQRPARSGLPPCNRFPVNPSLTLLLHRRPNDVSWDEWQ